MFKSRLLLLIHALCFLACLPRLGLADTQCSSTIACDEGCCSSSGYCGFGPSFCGSGNCTNSCDAIAQCGQYAPSNSTLCPLNVCCSQFGFCGTTSDFCDTGCQSGCDAVKEPSCLGSSASAKRIGYYESWSSTRDCDAWTPSKIDATMWTHLNYAFALISSDTYEISAMNDYDEEMWPKFTALKQDNNKLKTYISVGGWSAGGEIFSDMTSTSANRKAFINSVLKFMQTYDFDGIDVDWEYPAATDRGGNSADTTNFVTFLEELKASCGTTYGVTVTLPSSYWYLQGFDVSGMESYVDWFNFMAYDIHGTWDGENKYTSKVVQPHTNLTEIKQGLDLLWRSSITPSKVVLGLGFYGRSFTLADASCKKPLCAFSGGGNPGNCTITSGILSNAEIQRIITQYDLTPTEDKTAGVKWITWDSNQWVSYDDADTYKLKLDFANKLCLGGVMAWALDLDDPTTDQSVLNLYSAATGKNATSASSLQIQQKSVAKSNSIAWSILWTSCMSTPACPAGYQQLTTGHGKVFDADLGHLTANGCHGGIKGYNRALCIDKAFVASQCKWYGTPKGCKGKCPSGYTLVTQNSHPPNHKKGCSNGKYASYCCKDIASNPADTCAATHLNQALSGGLAARVVDVDSLQNKGYGSSGVGFPYLHTGPSCPDSQINYVLDGDVLVQMKGIYYNGDFHPDRVQEPQSQKNKKPTYTTTSTVTRSTTNPVKTRTCDGNRYPRPCANYRSIINKFPGMNPVTCAAFSLGSGVRTPRPAVVQYYYQHSVKYWSTWAKPFYKSATKLADYFSPKLDTCQADEWPPAYFYQGAKGGYVRYLSGQQNGGVPSWEPSKHGWTNLCEYDKDRKHSNEEGGPIIDMGNYYSETVYEYVTTTQNVMSFTWSGIPNAADDGLTVNECWPSVATRDPGFALLWADPWYETQKLLQTTHKLVDYRFEPSAALTTSKTAYDWKRSLDFEDMFVMDDGNSSRKMDERDLWENLAIKKCETNDCAKEREELGMPVVLPPPVTASDPIVTAASELKIREAAVASTRDSGLSEPTQAAGVAPTEPLVTAAPGTDNMVRHINKHRAARHRRHGG